MFLCGAHNESIGIFSPPRSVNQPFKGDYLEMGKNPKYQKLSSAVDEKVLLADVVNKINRANGKVAKANGSAQVHLSTASLYFLLLP